MKFLCRWLLRLCLLALVALAVTLVVRRFVAGKPWPSFFGFSLGRPLVAEPTPLRIRAVRDIGLWEFLSIDDEEVVDTIRRHWLATDDRLVRIYRGTLRLGVDFRQCAGDWALAYGDTVRVCMPEVHLLDSLFVDEARARSFHESGYWDAATRTDMLHRAEAAMRQRCLTPGNMQLARQAAREHLTRFFLALGYSHVVFEGDEGEE